MVARLVSIVGCLLLSSCSGAQKAGEYEYQPILPLCFVEEYPNETLGAHLTNLVPIDYREVLILPLYRSVKLGDRKHEYLLWNPFVVGPNDDIEAILANRGQRDELHRVLIWVPGYLPAAIPTCFRREWEVNGNGRTSTILELHKENWDKGNPARIAKPLGDLLKAESFEIGAFVDTRLEYDAKSLLRAVEYGSQYSTEHTVRNLRRNYVLWAFNMGTEVDIILDETAKVAVAKFLTRYTDPNRKNEPTEAVQSTSPADATSPAPKQP